MGIIGMEEFVQGGKSIFVENILECEMSRLGRHVGTTVQGRHGGSQEARMFLKFAGESLSSQEARLSWRDKVVVAECAM